MNSSKQQAFEKHRGQFREKATDLGHDVQELGKITKNLAEDTMGLLSSNASGYYQQGREKVQGLEKTIEKTIREHPLQSVAVAAGVGLILGFLWRRR